MSVKIKRSDESLRGQELKVAKHQKVLSTEKNFMGMLKEEAKNSSRDQLQKLLQVVDELGGRLAEDLSLQTLKAYRDSIRKFVYLAVRGPYEIKDEVGIDNFGSARSYKIVKKVDESLEELTQIMLKRHAAQLDIVARVSEIRGLLIDLTG